MEKTTNCPNCGAPIEGDKCPYCGTEVIDLCCLDTDKPFYVKLRNNGQIIKFKAMTRGINTESQYDYAYGTCLAYGESSVMTSVNTEIEITLSVLKPITGAERNGSKNFIFRK